MGSVEELSSTVGVTTTTTSYTAGGKRLAQAVNGAFSYLGSDGLGSAEVALDGGGNAQASVLYDPYGNTRYASGTMPGSYGYTGQRADAATGLDYYGARYYDAVAGQFVSADSVSAGGLNRYAYVGGDPETRTDTTGHLPVPPGGPLAAVFWDSARYSLYGHSLSQNVHVRPDLQNKPIVQRVEGQLLSQADDVIYAQNNSKLGGPNKRGKPKTPTYGAAVLSAYSLDTGRINTLSGVVTGADPVHAEQSEIGFAVGQIRAFKSKYGFDAAENAEYDVNLITTKSPCDACAESLENAWLNQLLAAAGEGGLDATVHLLVWVIQPAGWNPADPTAGNPDQSELDLWASAEATTSPSDGNKLIWWIDHGLPLPEV